MEHRIDSHIALGTEHHLRLDVPRYVELMNKSDIELAIARPAGAELAVFNRAGNDRILSAGPQFRALASANPWFGPDAVVELERCHRIGAVGLYLHPTRQGFMPTDPVAEPLVEFATKVKWPVVIHTGTYINSDVLAVAELARRYPHLTFICDGAGFSDMWFELPGVIGESPNVLFIASLIWPRAIANTIKNFGVERVLFGSGEPRDSLAATIARCDRLELSDDQRKAFFCDNARRVFGLP